MWLKRVAYAGSAALLLTLAAGSLALRFWLPPRVDNFRPELARWLTSAVGQPVVLGRLTAHLRGAALQLSAADVTVLDDGGRPAFVLDRIDGTLAWRSLVVGELRLAELVVWRPRLHLRRAPDGRIYLGGVLLDRPGAKAGLADWLLRQGRVVVDGGELVWEDQARGAPPLVLAKVGLRLESGFLDRHRLGLEATPPAALGGPLAIRLDVRGKTFDDLAGWRGTLYADLRATDLAALGTWIDLPYSVRAGRGSVRLWLDFAGQKVKAVTASVDLAGVRARLARDLPELDLASARGRVAFEALPRGFRLALFGLTAKGTGFSFPVTALALRYQAAAPGEAERGQVSGKGLDLAPLAALAEHLPFSPEQRRWLSELGMRGYVDELALSWQGPMQRPVRYAVKARFHGLGFGPQGALPGFEKIGGSIEADENGGRFDVAAQAATLTLPQVMRYPLRFDRLEGEARWRMNRGRVTVTLERVNFSNADVAGRVAGRLEAGKGPLWADLAGELPRGALPALWRYLPRQISQDTHDWLRQALLAGTVEGGRFRLKGDLKRFPFVRGTDGLFEASFHVRDGVLAPAEGWPRLANIRLAGKLRGVTLRLEADRASSFGLALGRAEVVIPDLMAPEGILEVQGDAHGPAAEFLRYLRASPLNDKLGQLFDQAQATGPAKLALRFTLPLRTQTGAKLSGRMEFTDNRLELGHGMPVLERLTGRVAFTESGLLASRLTASALGGPMTLDLVTTPDGVLRVEGAGRLSATALANAYPHVLTRALEGGSPWRLSVAVRDHRANFSLASDLLGLKIVLPAPLSKPAEERWRFTLVRTVGDEAHDRLAVQLGDRLSAHLARVRASGDWQLARGTVRLGTAELPNLPATGLWLEASLPALDLDAWRLLIADAEGGLPPLAGVRLKVGLLDVFGRRLHAVDLNAWRQGADWRARIGAEEMRGDATWRGTDGGRLTARLLYLEAPEESPATAKETAGEDDGDLPTLDIVAEETEVKGRKLGRLELIAHRLGPDWQLERLKISNPDAVLTGSGLWQSWLKAPTTRLRLELSVTDVGRLLGRLGYPDRIRRGTAKLAGELTWRGGPAAFDLATLGGRLSVEAHSGQFLKVDPGAGKLLGLLSLQALPRRLVLDFRDVFSEGFAFDNIAGTALIDQGILSTSDFTMQGPSALVTMAGTTDLVRGTQNLRVRIVPAVGEGLAAAAFLGGPVAGVTAFLLQKILKDPVGQMIAYEYQITGTWDDPQVVKLGGHKENP